MPDDAADRPQDPHVERLRPDPAQPAQQTVVLVGFLGDSDRPGRRRLYFTEQLDYYAEFRTDDVVSLNPVSAEESPFPGHEGTEVILKRDATIEYTHTRTPRPVDEFDLDVRLGSAGTAAALPFPTRATCDTCRTDCFGRTCDTCLRTCDTCQTQCNQATCAPTCATCATRCNQATCAPTCATCATQCNQATCVTCQTCDTQCNQPTCARTCDTCGRTCVTCDTCNPHVFTCGPNPQCRF